MAKISVLKILAGVDHPASNVSDICLSVLFHLAIIFTLCDSGIAPDKVA
jgi:hypothetical protein